MSNVTLTVRVTDSAGAVSAPATATITVVDVPIINSVTVSPQTAPAGTLRTITVSATDPGGLALTYQVTRSDNGTVTATAQPNVFTTIA